MGPGTRRPSRGALRAGEWPFVVVSAALTAFGLLLAFIGGREARTGIGLAAFFGLCLAGGIWLLWARRALRRSAEARRVEIVGSVPIRARVGRAMALLAVVAAVLLVLAWALDGTVARWPMLAAALLCAGLIPVLPLGPPGRRAIVFEPEGLRFVESKWELLVPWGEVAAARLVDVEGTMVAAFTLHDPMRVVPTPRAHRGEPADAQRRLARAIALNRAFYGCDLSTGPSAFGLDPVLFIRAVETYVSDVGARERLAPRAALDAGR